MTSFIDKVAIFIDKVAIFIDKRTIFIDKVTTFYDDDFYCGGTWRSRQGPEAIYQ